MVRNPLDELRSSEKAVSPVIGVILMVAVTVILAAVIAGFVMGMGDNVGESAPNVHITSDYDSGANGGDGALTITHNSGKVLNSENSQKIVVRFEGSSPPSSITFGPDGGESLPITAGEELISDQNTNSISGATVVWYSTSGDTTSTLGSWEKP